MGTKERRSREKGARRAAILQAAKAIFVRNGVLATTMDDIAQRAEVAKGTLYLHFRTKEEMFSALMDEGLALVVQRFGEAIDPSLPADENLRRLCDAYCRFYRQEPQYFKLLFFCSHADVRAKTCVNPGECQGLPPLAAVIQKGIDEKIFSATVDPAVAAAIVWASSNGLILMFEQERGSFSRPIEELLRANIDLFIRGLKANDEA